jgi:hypothetical protein
MKKLNFNSGEVLEQGGTLYGVGRLHEVSIRIKVFFLIFHFTTVPIPNCHMISQP